MVPSQNDFQVFHETFVANPLPLVPHDVDREDREACLAGFRAALVRVMEVCEQAATTPVGSWLFNQIGFRRARERISKQKCYRPVSDDEIADLANLFYGIHHKTFPAAIVDILSIEGVDSFQNERTVQKIAKQELDRIRERHEMRRRIHAANEKYLNQAA